MNLVVLVVVLVVVLALLLVAGALGVQRLRRQARDAGSALADELASAAVVRGPEPAEYAGSTGDVLRPRARGVLVLTDDRLLFREISGDGLVVELAGLVPEVAESFDGLRRLRRGTSGTTRHLVLRGERSAVGFVVEDPDAWRAAIGSADRDSPQE